MNDLINMFLKDKNFKKMIEESEKVSSELLTLARTYLGVWEKKMEIILRYDPGTEI